MVYRTLHREEAVEMNIQEEKLQSIRQDWTRSDISIYNEDLYLVNGENGYFATRKGLPKGFYILRLSINQEDHPTLCRVTIEPVGANKEFTKTFAVPIKSTESEPCLTLPINVTQRSRIKIKPTTKPGLVKAVFSILPTTESTLLILLRQWTTRKPKENDNTIEAGTYSNKQEISWRTEQMFRVSQIRHLTWPKKAVNDDIKQEVDEKYNRYIEEIEPTIEHDSEKVRQWLELNQDAPLISVIVPTYNTNIIHLRECIGSVLTQSYPNWELCICDDNSNADYVKTTLKQFESIDSRIKLAFRNENGHICNASNDALGMASGEYVALLDHDDVLSKNALYWVARELQRKPNTNLIYSDEDKIDNHGIRSCPHFKPAFNIDLLLSYNFISHLGVYRRDLIKRLGGFRVGLEGSQDHDLALRTVMESSIDQVIHIPRILYHWRAHPESTASRPDSKDYTTKSGLRAVQDFLDEQYRRGGAKATASIQTNNRFYCQWQLPNAQPSVELIIPTRDQAEVLKTAIDSIISKTIYSNYTITIVDNQSTERSTKELFKIYTKKYPDKIKIIKYNKKFNYSAINNYAVHQSDAEIVGLINNDVEVISENWLGEMVSHSSRPDIGCVGAKLYYSNGSIQHGGVIIGIGQVAGHAHKYFPGDSPGYVDRLQYAHQLTAVTAACLIIRREIYNEVGGLNEKDLTVAFNDVDFCLRVHARGYRNIFTPYAELYHHESISRGSEDSPAKQERFRKEINYILNQYDILGIKELPSDLFYNPSLTKIHENFDISCNPESIIKELELRASYKSAKSYYQKQ